MKARVYLETTMSATVTVEIPDDTDEDAREEVAIGAALDILPRQVCAQCSGWREPWGKEEGEYEAIEENPVEFVDDDEDY